MDRTRLSVPVLLIGIALLFGASQLPSVREYAAELALFAAPIALGVVAWNVLSVEGRARAAVAIGLVVGVMLTELVVHHAMFPGPPIAEADLTSTTSQAALPLPDGARDLDVEIDANVPHEGGVDGHATVTLERNGNRETLNAHFTRSTTSVRTGRQRMKGGSGSAHDEEHFRVSMPGEGPLVARLGSVDGGLGKKVHVALRPESALFGRTFPGLVCALLFLCALVEWRLGEARRAGVAAAALAMAALAWYLPAHLEHHDLYGSLLGAGFVALVAALLGAGLFSLTVRRAASRAPS
jgi:hypothetical protein